MILSPPISIVCFGSSLTESRGQAEGDKWVTRLHHHLQESHPGRFRVYNRGVGGNTTAMALERIETDVLPLMPGWVLIGFGGNDSNVRANRRTARVGLEEYESNMRELHRMVLAADGKPLFLNYHLPIPGRGALRDSYRQGNGKTHAENLRPYQDAVRRVASENHAPLVDLPRLMETVSEQSADLVIDDGIHLTARGNHFYGEHIAAFFREIAPEV